MTPHPGKGYRWVKVGEKLRKDDAAMGINFLGREIHRWIKTGYAGMPCPCPNYYRRRTTHEKKGMM